MNFLRRMDNTVIRMDAKPVSTSIAINSRNADSFPVRRFLETCPPGESQAENDVNEARSTGVISIVIDFSA